MIYLRTTWEGFLHFEFDIKIQLGQSCANRNNLGQWKPLCGEGKERDVRRELVLQPKQVIENVADGSALNIFGSSETINSIDEQLEEQFQRLRCFHANPPPSGTAETGEVPPIL